MEGGEMKIYILDYHFFDSISKTEMYFTRYYTSRKSLNERIRGFASAISPIHYEVKEVKTEK